MLDALPKHPRTGLLALGIIGGHPVWPVMGAADDDGTGGEPRDDAKSDDATDWKAEAEKWKAQSRKHEDRAKANTTAAKERDDLVAANASEQEKAVKAARDEARAEALREATPRIVRAEFRAAAKGLLTADQLGALLEDLDLSKYVTEAGDVDEDKVAKKVKALAPEEDPKRRRLPDLGQGPRADAEKGKGAAGVAEAERRFAKTKTS